MLSALPLILCRDVAVARGVKAVNMIHNITTRIPHLMKQSHLETNEGKGPVWCRNEGTLLTRTMSSLGSVLVANLQSAYHPVHKPLPGGAKCCT